ncbi:MAG: methyltransferase domain-containing protein, partial [Candidatus Manganitrophaceae bacterium]
MACGGGADAVEHGGHGETGDHGGREESDHRLPGPACRMSGGLSNTRSGQTSPLDLPLPAGRRDVDVKPDHSSGPAYPPSSIHVKKGGFRMMQESILHEGSRLFAPGYRQIESNDQALLIDPEAPHWVITDRRGARILGDLDGKKTFGQVVADYCRAFQVDWAKGWLHCHTFLQNALRTGFVAPTPLVRAPYKHLCDGEDLEQTGLISGWFFGEDPFFEFHERGIVETLFSLAETRCRQKPPSGYDRPMIYAAMGEATLKEVREGGAQAIGGFEVALSRSTGVLSADLDRSRRVVSDFYGEAAKTPQPQLCCPGGYPEEALSHIPREALEIAYGCGSPVDLAGIQPGETVVDLGSGGGIDCFIAAKKVGATGRVIGIDMTDAMLAKANRSKSAVAKNLGYDVVEFKKGYLEEIPLPAQFADLIT